VKTRPPAKRKTRKVYRVHRRVRNPEYKPIGPELLLYKYPSKGGAYRESMDDLHVSLLTKAGQIFDDSASLDTCVRDTVCKGLAYLVHTAYDCRAIAMDLKTVTSPSLSELDDFDEFITRKTAQWFLSRGCAEWFAMQAAQLFTTTRPDLAYVELVNGPRKRKNKVKT
jgi:hypothetical protein